MEKERHVNHNNGIVRDLKFYNERYRIDILKYKLLKN